MTQLPRRRSYAYLLWLVGGFIGAHRFYLGSYLGGAAQLALLLYGMAGLPGSRFGLVLVLPWLLFDLYWIHRQLARQGAAGARKEDAAARRNVRRAAASDAKDFDLAALAEASRLQERFVAAAEADDWAGAVAIGEQVVASARRVFKGPHQNLAMSLCMLGQA